MTSGSFVTASYGPKAVRKCRDAIRALDPSKLFEQQPLGQEKVVDGRRECICVQGITKCPKHGDQPAKRGLCPRCAAVLGYCPQGEYCTSDDCDYAY